MDDCVTFTSVCGKFEFTVKSSFFGQSGVTKETPIYQMFQNYKLAENLHNPNGPAMRHFETGHKEYFINGIRCDEETEKKIEHNMNFNNKFMDILQKDDTQLS
jgi:hypothetical protein